MVASHGRDLPKRYVWAKAFWHFWYSAKLVSPGVWVLLVHMDEKWFYCIIIWKNNKEVPYYSCFPVQHHVHHKSHINKVMALASTAFLPHNNNMGSGGVAFKVCLARARQMEAAQCDTYWQVTREDSSFHYPQRQRTNSTRGELYFQNMEVTGSSDGTTKEPKYSLLQHFCKKEIPALESIIQQLSANNPNHQNHHPLPDGWSQTTHQHQAQGLPC
jgi:hypothetical protein